MDDLNPFDADAVVACADLAERAGASSFECGYDPDRDERTRWYAKAEYANGGHQLVASGHPGPEAAAMALAARILTGAKCKCGGLVALSVDGAWAPAASATMLDGSDPRVLRDAPQCLWILDGQRWESGCDAPALAVRPDPAG